MNDKGIKEIFAENLKTLRKRNDETTTDLSLAIGVAQSTISDWENGRKMPRAGSLEKLSMHYNVNKTYLITDHTDYVREDCYEYATDIRKLPIYGNVSCGNGVIAYENIEGYEDIPSTWIKGGSYFLLKAKGDSMINARIQDGDLLLIRKQETFENGEIIAVEIDNEAVLKRIYKIDGAIMLQSENSKYPPRIVTNENDIRIIGKLKMNLIRY